MKALRRVLVGAVVLAILALSVRLLMPFAARRLIRSDPLVPADAIVVLGSYRLERAVEAGILYREGWSQRILLLRPPDIGSNGILRALHVNVPRWLDIQRSALTQMAVPADAVIPSPSITETTRKEADFAVGYARRAGWKRIIVVTSPYHTRRAGRFFRNAAGASVVVIMRADRYERAEPGRWWQRPGDRADVVFEYLKTLHALGSPDD